MKKILKKVLIPICLSILCGVICAKLVYQIYDSQIKEEVEAKKIYLVQAGTYDSYDNMVSNTLVSNYVYYEDKEGKFNSIVGITEDYSNIEKIKNSYGSDVIVSEYLSEDPTLNNKINNYDKELAKLTSEKDIQAKVLEMLKLYKGDTEKTLVKIKS